MSTQEGSTMCHLANAHSMIDLAGSIYRTSFSDIWQNRIGLTGKEILHWIGCINAIRIKYNRCTDDVKSKLFQAYCWNVYCSQLWWNYISEAYKKFVVACNNCFWRLLGYNLTCSASQMFLHNNVHHFSVSRRKSIYSFLLRIKSCHNLLVQNV